MQKIQEMGNQTAGSSRRKFLTDSAKKAAWVAPALTLMMAASATPAQATHKYGSTKNEPNGYATKPKSGYKFWKVWHQVHRGRQM